MCERILNDFSHSLPSPVAPNKEDMYMTKKTRSDCTVGTFEKKEGLPPGTIRNSDGRDTRSDKKIGTIRKEGESKEK